MTATRPDALSRDEALAAAVHEALAQRLHAMADAMVTDLMADVLMTLLAVKVREEAADDHHLPAM